MNLYLVRRIERVTGRDEHRAMVIAAASSNEARLLAAASCQDEGPMVWLNSDDTALQHLGTADQLMTEQVILSDTLTG